MITHTPKSNGGEIVVSHNKETVQVDFTISNKELPVAYLRCSTNGRDCKTILGVVNALVEKYSPVVFILQTPIKELLYTGNIGTVKRIATQKENSIYCSSMHHKEIAKSLWEISRAIDDGYFIEGSVFSSKQYERLGILKIIRESTTPFEFLSMKEEYDFAIKKKRELTCSRMIEKCKQYSLQNQKYSNCFKESSSRIEKIYKSNSELFESNISCVESCVVGLLLPAIILLGENNEFTKSLFLIFTESCDQYINTSSEFLKNYKFAIRNA